MEGGYSDDIFAEEVHARFFCNVCCKVLRDPHLMLCCGEKYCVTCLEHWFTAHHSESCPHCREEKGSTLLHTQEKGMKREIDSFKVYCPRRGRGCEWVNELRERVRHDLKCDYAEVECTNKCESEDGVVTRVLHKDLVEHLKEHCDLRLVECRYCNDRCSFKQHLIHFEVCDFVPVDCPNACGQYGIIRRDVISHRGECPREIIECENVGCQVKLKRESMCIHEAEECAWREIQCEYCSDFIICIYSQEHEENCLMYPLSCPNGCEEIVVRYLLNSHRTTCTLEPVECTLGCKAVIVRSKLPDHVKDECELRSVNCRYCNVTVMATNLSKHCQECDSFPTKCPNKCGQQEIMRKDIEHHKTVCPLEIVDCTYAHVGCTEEVKRKMLQKHEQRKMKFHLDLMNKAYSDCQQKLHEKSLLLNKTQQVLADKDIQLKQTSLDLEKLTSDLEDSVLNAQELQYRLEDAGINQ